MAEQQFPVHPIVEKLGQSPSVKLLGYFGSSSDGLVKIYPNLDDLSVYYNVNEADILHVEDATADEAPHGGSAIWIKANASVTHHVSQQTSTEARFLAGPIAAQIPRGPAVAARAPIGIQPDTAACNGFSVWPCSVAWGACLPSGDDPCANTQQWGCQIFSANSCVGTCAGFTCVAECNTNNPQCPPHVTQFCTKAVNFTHCCAVNTLHCGIATAHCKFE